MTVLRDGQLIDTVSIADIQPNEVVGKMVGRTRTGAGARKAEIHIGDVVLSARGIKAPGVDGIDLDVPAGQIVGLGGLVGAGRTELVRAIVGADLKTAGTVTITKNGQTKRVNSYRSAIAHGFAYVPEERRTDGLALTMTVADNVALPNRGKLSNFSVLLRAKIAQFTRRSPMPWD